LRVQEPRTWTERARQGSSLLGFWHLRGFVCARVGVSREPSTPKRARPSSFSPRAPVSQHLKTLGSFRRGALPLQSLHLLTRPGIPAGRTHLSFRRPVSASEREPLPLTGWREVVRDLLRVRPRAFSTPRRFAQAHVPRPYFVPQPVPGCLSVESSPRRDRVPVSGSLGSLEVPHLRARRSLPDLVTASFPPPARASCFPTRASQVPLEAMDSLSVDVAVAFPVALDPQDRGRLYRRLSPLRSFDPSASPFASGWVTPTARSILDARASPETHRPRLGASNPPPGSRRNLATRAPSPKARARGARDQEPLDRARPRAENDARPTRQTPAPPVPRDLSRRFRSPSPRRRRPAVTNSPTGALGRPTSRWGLLPL
jgi:hypothetical protein